MKYIINDIDEDHTHELERLDLTVVCARGMSETLTRLLEKRNFNQNHTLLVFPGNGGDIIRGFLNSHWLHQWEWTTVFAKRFWNPGSPPEATASRIFPNRFRLDLKNVVVIDDVVSSGETARMLKERNEPWIPGAKWHVATWMIQKAANLPGFSSTRAVHVVGERNRKVPINSLSTFLSVPEIAENYARRNLDGQAHAFLELLKQFRSMRR